MKPVLTISIMTANRIDTLPKTLESIKPILDNVPSELIITDTGCSDELLSIIRRYTDNIIKFTWCNDFAIARNVGLKEAKGKWFMFIDDDEWFEDVTPITNFFNNEDIDNFNRLQYLVRNYNSYEGTSYSDVPVDRGFRIRTGVEFVGQVHEHINDTTGNVKRINCYAHHYGYAYRNEEEKKAHANRNIPLAKAYLRTNPHDARAYAQMIQEYNCLGEYDTALQYANEGLKKVDIASKSEARHINGFLCQRIFAIQKNGCMEVAMKHAIEALNYNYLGYTAKAYIYMYLNGAYMELGDYEKALYYGLEYFKVIDYINVNADIIFEESTALIGEALVKESLYKVFYIALQIAATNQDEETCIRVMKYADPNWKIKYLDEGLWLTELAKLMLKSEHKELYGDTLQMFIKK